MLQLPASVVQNRPLMLCEYAHAMENSLGNFKEYWDVFERHDNIAGAFVWDFVDQAIRKATPEGEQWLYGGDFGEEESNYYFCANGMIGADRKPHPSLLEAKRVMQNVAVEPIDMASGKVRIRNKHYFTNLSDYRLAWRIEAEGRRIAEGCDDTISIAPQSSMEYALPVKKVSLPQKECFILVAFELKRDTGWARRGYCVAAEQFLLQEAPAAAPRAQGDGGMLKVREENGEIRIENENVSLALSSGTGYVTGLSIAGRRILSGPLEPNYYRAMTDNDRGFTNFNPEKLLKLVEGFQWKNVAEEMQLVSCDISDEGKAIRVDCRYRHALFSGETALIYKIDPSGAIRIRHEATPAAAQPYRIGMTAQLPGECRRFAWYGRGPHESYCDRKTGADISLYEANLEELEHRYMRPQENGNRTDVRWLSAQDAHGQGFVLRDLSGEHMGFSAHAYSQNELDSSEHLHELPNRTDKVYLNIDAKQCGVGGDLPGFALLKTPYVIQPGKRYVQEFEITGANL
jgi:beta-galactosidase